MEQHGVDGLTAVGKDACLDGYRVSRDSFDWKPSRIDLRLDVLDHDPLTLHADRVTEVPNFCRGERENLHGRSRTDTD